MTQKVNLGYQWLTQQTIRFDPRLSLELDEVLQVRILNLFVSPQSSRGLWNWSTSGWGKS